jgi:hypothetical protein
MTGDGSAGLITARDDPPAVSAVRQNGCPAGVGVDPQWLLRVIRAILDMPQQQAQIVSSAAAAPPGTPVGNFRVICYISG